MQVLNIILSPLLQLLKTDEKVAIKEIFKKFRPDLMNFIKTKLGNYKDLAEDIYQETALSFLKFEKYQSISFLNENKLKNYLLTIAMNKIRDSYRKNINIMKVEKIFKTKEEMNYHLDKISYELKCPEKTILTLEEKKHIHDIVTLTLEKLPDKYKVILKLKFIENKNNTEISQVLFISIKAVESLLFRARKSFKKNFEKTALYEDIFTPLHREEKNG